jgi:hypothetical protein
MNNVRNIKESSDTPVTSFNIYIDTSHEQFKEHRKELVSKILFSIITAVEQGFTMGNVCDEDEKFLAMYYFKDPTKLN